MAADIDDAPPTWRELFGDGHALITAILCLGLWLNAADALVVSTIMPSVAKDVGGYQFFSWATAAFMLGSILAGAVAGLVAGRVGLRWSLAVSALVYAGGCVGSALATSIWPFLLGRGIQGVGAGFIIGLCYVAVRAAYPERLWALMIAAMSGIWGVATLLGPLIGGVLAGADLWRWVFWSFAVQALLFMAAVFKLPGQANPDEPKSPGIPFPQLSVLMVAVALMAVASVIKIVPAAAATAVGAVVMLAAAVRLEGRSKTRLLPEGATRFSGRAGRGYAAVLTLSTSIASFSVYAVALLQARLHLSPLTAGYVAASQSIGWTVVAVAAARLPKRLQPQTMRIGPALIAIGLAGCAATLSNTGIVPIVIAGAVMGSGFGLCWSFISQAVLADVPEEQAALGSAAVPTVQLLGSALGAAAAGVLGNALGLSAGFGEQVARHAAPVLVGAFVPIALLGVFASWRLGEAQSDAVAAE